MANASAAAVPRDDDLHSPFFGNVPVRWNRQLVSILSQVVADATTCPPFFEKCQEQIDHSLVPVPLTNLWVRERRVTSDQFNAAFMQEAFNIIVQNAPLEVPLPGAYVEGGKTLRKIQKSRHEFKDFLTSGSVAWNYEAESSNTNSIVGCLNDFNRSYPINTLSLFTGIGFDKKMFDDKDLFGFCPHVQPAVNNRGVTLGWIYQDVPATVPLDSSKSMWHYMTHKNRDLEESDTCLSQTTAYSVVTKCVPRDSLTNLDPAKVAKLAPSNDMWDKAVGNASLLFESFEGTSIIGDPVSVPMTYADAKELFKFLTDSDYENCYSIFNDEPDEELKEQEIDNGKMAIFCLHDIMELLSTETNYDQNTIMGKLHLYGRLLLDVVDLDLLTELNNIAGETHVRPSRNLGYDPKVLAGHLWNLFLPNDVEELNLRLLFLWNRRCKIRLNAMEGQKRKVTNIWNLLGIQPTKEPIVAFHSIPKKMKINFRQTPNSAMTGVGGWKSKIAWEGADACYFARTSALVDTHLLGFRENDIGLTIMQTLCLRGKSAQHAESNTRVQPKTANEYLKDLLMMMREDHPSFSMNVSFTSAELDAEGMEGCYDNMEKNVRTAVMQNRRDFIVRFCHMCHENKFIESHTVSLSSGVEEFAKRKACIELENLGRDSEDVVSCGKDFFNSWDPEFYLKCRNKTYYLNPRKDDIFDYCQIYVPPSVKATFDLKGNCLDPKTPEFYFGLYLVHVKDGGGIGRLAHGIPKNLKPRDLQVLSVVFSHAVFSLNSMKHFVSIFHNNGNRAAIYKPDEFVVDVGVSGPLPEFRHLHFWDISFGSGPWIDVLQYCVWGPTISFAHLLFTETKYALLMHKSVRGNYVAKDEILQRYFATITSDLVKLLSQNSRYVVVRKEMETYAPTFYQLLTSQCMVNVPAGLVGCCKIKGKDRIPGPDYEGAMNIPVTLAAIIYLYVLDRKDLAYGSGEPLNKKVQSYKTAGIPYDKTKDAGVDHFHVFNSIRQKLLVTPEFDENLHKRGQGLKYTDGKNKVGQFMDMSWDDYSVSFKLANYDEESFNIGELVSLINTGRYKNPTEYQEDANPPNVDNHILHLAYQGMSQTFRKRQLAVRELWQSIEAKCKFLHHKDKKTGQPNFSLMMTDVINIACCNKFKWEPHFFPPQKADDFADEYKYDLSIEPKYGKAVKKGEQTIASVSATLLGKGVRALFHEALLDSKVDKVDYDSNKFQEASGKMPEGALLITLADSVHDQLKTQVQKLFVHKNGEVAEDADDPDYEAFLKTCAKDSKGNRSFFGLEGQAASTAAEVLLLQKQLADAKKTIAKSNTRITNLQKALSDSKDSRYRNAMAAVRQFKDVQIYHEWLKYQRENDQEPERPKMSLVEFSKVHDGASEDLMKEKIVSDPNPRKVDSFYFYFDFVRLDAEYKMREIAIRQISYLDVYSALCKRNVKPKSKPGKVSNDPIKRKISSEDETNAQSGLENGIGAAFSLPVLEEIAALPKERAESSSVVLQAVQELKTLLKTKKKDKINKTNRNKAKALVMTIFEAKRSCIQFAIEQHLRKMQTPTEWAHYWADPKTHFRSLAQDLDTFRTEKGDPKITLLQYEQSLANDCSNSESTAKLIADSTEKKDDDQADGGPPPSIQIKDTSLHATSVQNIESSPSGGDNESSQGLQTQVAHAPLPHIDKSPENASKNKPAAQGDDDLVPSKHSAIDKDNSEGNHKENFEKWKQGKRLATEEDTSKKRKAPEDGDGDGSSDDEESKSPKAPPSKRGRLEKAKERKQGTRRSERNTPSKKKGDDFLASDEEDKNPNLS